MTYIQSSVFSGCTGLIDLTMADGAKVLGIEEKSFADSPLKNLYIGRNIYEYSYNIFSNIETLENVTIGDSVTNIGIDDFSGCTGLTSIEIPNSVKSIDDRAFYGCTGLTDLTIADGTNEIIIYNRVFENCPLKYLYIGKNFKGRFLGFNTLEKVIIGDSVTSIPEYGFSNCTGLTSIEIPNNVTAICARAFEGCTGLISVEIPNSVENIYDLAFSGCTGLTSVSCLSEKPRTMSENAFDSVQYENVTLTVPAAVKRDYQKAPGWRNFYNVKGVDVPEINSPYNKYDFVIDGIYYKFTDLANLEVGVTIGEEEYVGDVVIPDNVVYKGKTLKVTSVDGLYGCRDLKSVKIPATARTIEKSAFSGCWKLTKLVIPASVTNVGSSAFSNCTGLKELIIENGTEELTMESSSLSNCPLEKVFIGRNIDDIFYNIKTLRDVTIGTTVTEIGGRFSGCNEIETLSIESGTEKLVFEETGSYANCNNILFGKAKLKTLYIGRDCEYKYGKKIYPVLYSNNTTLERIFIGPNVSQIDDEMFKGCTALNTIYCENPEPCTLLDAFDNTHYLNTNVYVPIGSLATYQAANGWRSFWNVMEYDVTGIEGVKPDVPTVSNVPTAIYTLNGKKVSETQKGQIYIFRYGNGKTVKKLMK